ncbi:MAG: ECF transporter S component [Ruminococcus sp.]|nr:ECF transporter S component [Ruminococcus sp.]
MNNEHFKRALFILSVLTLGAAAGMGAVNSGSGRNMSLSITAAAASGLLAMAAFSGRIKEPHYITLVSVLSALSVTGRIVFAPFAGFKPCTAVIITAGMCLGCDAGFITGALTALVSNFYFGQGSWTLYQMLAWGIVGIAAGLSGKLLQKSRAALLIFAALSGGVYSLIMDVFSTFWADGYFNMLRFAALTASSLPLTITYAVSNVVFIAVLSDRLCFTVLRIKNKYGIGRKI